MENVEKQILSTIVYFDCFDRPLTLDDMHKFLVSLKHLDIPSENLSKEKILNYLNGENLKEYLAKKDIFYFLNGKEELCGLRSKREAVSARHFKFFKKYISLLTCVSFVRGISLSGSLALKNIREDSDWDLFFIMSRNRLYFSTLCVSFMVALFFRKWQRFGFKNIFCLNHFISDGALSMSAQSIYEAAEFYKMLPVFEEDECFYNFISKNKNWMEDYFCNVSSGLDKSYLSKVKAHRFLLRIKRFTEKILSGKMGDWCEKLSKKIIASRIERNKKKNKGIGRIVLDENQIEYHPRSPQKEVIAKYNTKMKSLGFEELTKEKDSGLYWIE